MVTPARIQVNGTSTYLDGVTVDQGLGGAIREGVAIGDPTTGSAMATVTDTTPSASDYGVVTRATLYGTDNVGETIPLSVNHEGHAEVAIHGPLLPFGSVHTESIKPIIQGYGVNGLNTTQLVPTTGLSVGTGSNSGAYGVTGNKIYAETGTTQYSFAAVQTRRRVKYRPGQGVIGRFAGHFSTPAASSILVAGFGTGESSVCFGYNGTRFGILHSTGGVREVHTLTITTASTSTQNYQVTMPNTTVVTVTGATNNASTARTAYEVAQGSFPGYSAYPVGSAVIFVADSVGNKSGSFSLAQSGAGTPATATDAETLAGVAATDTWYYPTFQPGDTGATKYWNGDPLDGTGPSGFTIDPTKGNVYKIHIQYLGFGCITFFVEATYTNANNPEFIAVHTIKYPNTSTTTSLSQPNFPFLMAAYSTGSITNVGVYIASYFAGIEGEEVNIGPRMSYPTLTGVTSSTSAYTPIFTFQNEYYYAGRANQTVIKLINATGACKSNTGLTTFFLIRNATLTGNSTSFQRFSSGKSCTTWDTGATGCTFSTNDQVVWSGTISESGEIDHVFGDKEITVQPGEAITLAVRSVTATATCVGALNTREDQ